MILCLVRIVGACCQLGTYQSQSTGLLEATIILDADAINQNSKTVFSALHFRLIQLAITLGLILSIVGGTNSITPTGQYKVQATSEAGIVLYMLCYMALGAVSIITLTNISYLTSGESRLMWAVIVAMPLILVRLIFSLLVIFHHSHTFSLVAGSALVHALMAVVEEMLVVFVYLGVGWTLATGAAARSIERPITSRPWKGNGTAGAGRRGNGGRRQGPIHGLVGMAVSAAQKHGSKEDGVEAV
ncbi:hypothetical protein B0A55_11093 [Friedmanniomyces simplex]|uniref:DUF7702 domain-containing protein n=1 Tax=Friedmanniomyces simplex TaxID=329884 RepID=A0A4U0WKM6_9PEZI|nr:hypothetical protein B0A55_11093 [Friedmanniomyces simplex]